MPWELPKKWQKDKKKKDHFEAQRLSPGLSGFFLFSLLRNILLSRLSWGQTHFPAYIAGHKPGGKRKSMPGPEGSIVNA